jgi:hypothetical protein
MIVVCQVLFNPSKPLVTAMAPPFFHDDNNSCLEAGQAGSDRGYDAEPMTDWQAWHSN